MIFPRRHRRPDGSVTGFRWKLLAAVALVVAAVTGLGIYVAERNASRAAEADFEREFQVALVSLHHVQELRYAEIAGRCDALVHNARIHAALEDDALDLLYFNARDQLRGLVRREPDLAGGGGRGELRANFYRFLDARGAMIAPPNEAAVGALTTLEKRQLAVSALPDREQIGYLARTAGTRRGTVDEVVLVPIVSSETGGIISALMVGFEPVSPRSAGAATRIEAGVWVGDTLSLGSFGGAALAQFKQQIRPATDGGVDAWKRRISVVVDGAPYLVFSKVLNPGSIFPPADEVCVYPLADSLAAQRRLRWQIGGLGGLALCGGFGASLLVSRKFAAPVERLASDSAEHVVQRAHAEAALEATSRELQRAARFSADASHQLKTPVTVLRAGLEELLTDETLASATRDELTALVHQTYRLNHVIDDLLLLSRMDAGRLRLEIGEVDLTHLIETWLDDLSVLPDPLGLDVTTDLPSRLCIAGEKRYTTLIVQNLLENARKYNRAGGRVSVIARDDGPDGAVLVIGNTGPAIAAEGREHIFERFHRGAAGEDVPGHGLGLNLARELARLHGGELRLVRSGEDWTEFAVRFLRASPGGGSVNGHARS